MMRSIRTRLLLGTIAGTTALFLIAAIAIYAEVHHALRVNFDGTLASRAHAIGSLVDVGEHCVKSDLDPAQMPEFQTSRHTNYFVIWDDKGRVLTQSKSLTAPWPEPFETRPLGTYRSYVTLPSGRAGRRVLVSFQPQLEEDEHVPKNTTRPVCQILIAADTDDLDDTLFDVAALVASVFGGAIVASAGVLLYVVNRGLKPMATLAERIGSLDAQSLSNRIELANVPQEMRPIIDQLNQLLEQLAAAFSRERAFTADVAHELRTPLAGLTTALEVAASRRRTEEQYEKTILQCLAVSQSMRYMVENLLMLARADANHIPLNVSPVDLRAATEAAWQHLAPQAEKQNLKANWICTGHPHATADSNLLGNVLQNLFDNAIGYASPGSTIDILIVASPQTAAITIQNQGSNVAAADSHLVFERFWRGDTARTQAARHAGLGLAICRQIMTLQKGTIEATSQLHGTFAITLTLPAVSAPVPAFIPQTVSV